MSLPVHGRSFTIRGVRVFDGTSTTDDRIVVVDSGRIVAVGADVPVPDATTVVDGRGCTLLPGLIDAHTHATPGQLGQAAQFGVTTELDMFNDPVAAAQFREQAAASLDGADFRSAGTGATVPGGHPIPLTVDVGMMPAFPTVDSPADAERFVAARVAEGSNYLKIFVEPGRFLGTSMPVLDSATLDALVAHAHDRDLLSAAHCTDQESARRAIDAGVDGLAHVFVDTDERGELVGSIADAGAFVVPTLVMIEGRLGLSRAEDLLTDSDVGPYLDATSHATLGQATTGQDPEALAIRDDVLGNVAALRDAGVTLLAGTDAINPGTAHGASIHRELELLVQAGLSPAEALTAATSAPARRFALADRGRIAPGLVADLLLVRGDPTVDIRATRNVVGVWRAGSRVPRRAVDGARDVAAG